MDNLLLPQKSNNKTSLGFRSPSHVPPSVSIIAHVHVEISQYDDGVPNRSPMQDSIQFSPITLRRREATLLSTVGNSNIVVPHTLGNSGEEQSPALSRSLVPVQMLCMKVSSTSCTNSGSFPSSEVTFHVPEASLCQLGPVYRHSPPSLPPFLAAYPTPVVLSMGDGPAGWRSGQLLQNVSSQAPWQTSYQVLTYQPSF